MLLTHLIWRERRSDSRLVESVWTSSAPVTVSRSVIADPCTSITLVKDRDGSRIVLSGPRTKPQSARLDAGYACISIRLKPGVSLKNLTTRNLVNNMLVLPADAEARFWFEGIRLQFPDFDRAELLIERLQRAGYLDHTNLDRMLLLAGGTSARTRSRQIHRATGLSPYQLYQLQRIHQALRLLKQGMPAVEVASELDFTDQSHLIRAAKHFCGHTPRQLSQLPQTP